jgi:regulatory protein
MKITSVSPQIKNNNRVNISVDGKYRFSLDVFQLVDLGIKVGGDFDESELILLEQESQFGKLYGRALEYCLMRLHSAKEVKDYLYRKTRPARNKLGELRPGVSFEITTRVFDRLIEKGYIDDEKFAKFWSENRCITKGASSKKIRSELFSKGISSSIINQVLGESERDDKTELQKIIIKKRPHYTDDKKFISYLARLGFNYDDIKQALSINEDF